MTPPDNIIIAIKHGLAGTSVAFTTLGLSFLEHIEQSLRITSLVVGITVGVLTIVSMVRKLRKP